MKGLNLPWTVGYHDRGLGRGDFAVLVKSTGALVVECPDLRTARRIVRDHNRSLISAEREPARVVHHKAAKNRTAYPTCWKVTHEPFTPHKELVTCAECKEILATGKEDA